MKTTKPLVITLNFALLSCVAALVGCASSNYQKGSAAGAGLQESAQKITEGSGKIDVVVASLNEIVNSPGDLPAQYKKFSTAVGGLESAAKDVQSKVAGMRAKGNEYFKAWDEQTAQIQNEDIKTRSTARRTEMSQRFLEIKKSYIEAGDAFKPFMSDLKDIQLALSTDLTTGGVSAIKGAADKATKGAVPVKTAVEKLATQFRELGVAMSAAAPQPTAQPTP